MEAELTRIKAQRLAHLKEHASHLKPIPFLTTNTAHISPTKMDHLNQHINRDKTVCSFMAILRDINKSIEIEAGIYEFALVTSTTRNYVDSVTPNVYTSKVDDLLQNLDPFNEDISNHTLRKAITQGHIKPQAIAFMTPQELHPERWAFLVKKLHLKEENKKNVAVTDLYECRKCKKRRCRVMELQTRSADEPMTQIITCVSCGHEMRQ